MPRQKRSPNRRRLTDIYMHHLEPPTGRSLMIWDTLQSGLAVRVRPTGTKTFKVAYRHQGRLRWYTLDRYPAIGIAEARDMARKIRAQATLGADPQGEKVQSRVGETLNHVAQAYVERYASQKNKSWKHAAGLMNSYVLPKFGNRKARDIMRSDIRGLFDGLTESGKVALANQVLAAVSAVFSWAVEHEIVAANPCQGIKRNKVKPSSRFLSNDEIRTVWPLFDDLGFYRSRALRLILLMGQRPGEVCSMRWDDVDLNGALWTLPGEPVLGWPGTKNARTHEVPLSAPVISLLHDLHPRGTGHVFPAPRIKTPISIPALGDVWRAAGIPRFRPHDLRATVATGMDRLGIMRQHISLVLNHVEGGVTAGYVRHDKREHKRNALEAWATELTAILAGDGRTDRTADVVQLAEATK